MPLRFDAPHVVGGWARKEAKLRVKVAERIEVSERYRTLFFGLKLNHERNAALVHPLMFLIRRMTYAMIIVWANDNMLFGIFLVQFSTLIMLTYACTEW